jgi:probable addiction module antidote protein
MATRKRVPEKFARYDSAEYLKGPEEIAEYLAAAFEEGGGDAAYMAHVIGTAARAHGMMQLAKQTGLTREGLYKALAQGGNPSFDTIVRVMEALGVKLVPHAARAPSPEAPSRGRTTRSRAARKGERPRPRALVGG